MLSMGTSEWLHAHREEIFECWHDHLRELCGGSTPDKGGVHLAVCFRQLTQLLNDPVERISDPEVESKLLQCPDLGRKGHHLMSARVLASGRRALVEVAEKTGGEESGVVIEECAAAIDYLQQALRLNVCNECPEETCCLRARVLRPL